MLKGKLMKLTAASLLVSSLAFSKPVFAQEIRRPTEAPKKFEFAASVKSRQGFGGFIWRDYAVPVAQANGTINLNKAKDFKLEGVVWACYDSKKRTFEGDLGIKLIKEFSEYFIVGVQAAAYSIKRKSDGKPIYNYSASITVPIEKLGLGFGASFDFRNLRRYELSASYTFKITEDLNHEVRLMFRDSYSLRQSWDIVNITGWKFLYLSVKVSRALNDVPGYARPGKPVVYAEAGARIQK
jgi:hypothetical protein